MAVYKGLLIKEGKIEPIDIDTSRDGATDIHSLVGDTFTSCFFVPVREPTSFGRMLVGYCDDNFLQKDLPLNVILTRDLYNWESPGYAIHGPIVITAMQAPDTKSMTDSERSRFYIIDHPQGPLLRYRDGDTDPIAIREGL